MRGAYVAPWGPLGPLGAPWGRPWGPRGAHGPHGAPNSAGMATQGCIVPVWPHRGRTLGPLGP